jgi:hypothetical protein
MLPSFSKSSFVIVEHEINEELANKSKKYIAFMGAYYSLRKDIIFLMRTIAHNLFVAALLFFKKEQELLNLYDWLIRR